MIDSSEDKARILVVDDLEGIRSYVSLTLRKAGYEVAVAEDAPTALAHIGSNHVDIVLTDLVMPGPSGVDLINMIKQDHPGILTLAMTGEAVNLDIQEALDSGALICIRKPFSAEHLLEKIDELDRSRRRRVIRKENPSESSVELTPVRDRSRNRRVMVLVLAIAVAVAIVVGVMEFKKAADRDSGTAEPDVAFPFR